MKILASNMERSCCHALGSLAKAVQEFFKEDRSKPMHLCSMLIAIAIATWVVG